MVICVLLALVAVSLKATFSYESWRLGRTAGETLRAVYNAQRTYLSDNPTKQVNTITQNDLLPYLPNSPAVFPTLVGLKKVPLSVRVNVTPPVVTAGAGANGEPYDPSGSPTDSLWDVGEQ